MTWLSEREAMSGEWDEIVDDAPDDLDVEIAFIEVRLAALKAARATRALSEACKGIGDAFRVAADRAILNSEIIDDCRSLHEPQGENSEQ